MDEKDRQHLNEVAAKVATAERWCCFSAREPPTPRGPGGESRAQMVKDHFPNVDQSLNDFIEVCQDVLDTPPYDRNQLEEFVRGKLSELQPSQAHMAMTKYGWPAIFTTNFDDLIELSFTEPGGPFTALQTHIRANVLR